MLSATNVKKKTTTRKEGDPHSITADPSAVWAAGQSGVVDDSIIEAVARPRQQAAGAGGGGGRGNAGRAALAPALRAPSARAHCCLRLAT